MPKKTFVCLNCNNEYFSRKENSKFCSKECQHLYSRIEHFCDYCGKPHMVTRSVYEKYKNGIYKKLYCSKNCANKGAITSETKICENCGKKFTVFKSVKDITKFCSRECYEEYRGKKDKLETKICEKCGMEFQTYHHQQKYCSSKCRSKASQVRETCACENCGKEFERIKSEVIKNKKHFCSKDCMYEFWRWKENDIVILKENYGKIKTREIQQMLSRQYSLKVINKKAADIGLAKNREWTYKERNIIKNFYDKVPMNQILQMLPNRTPSSILHMAQAEGIQSYFYINRLYSPDEIKYLTDNYLNKSNEKLAEKLNRTTGSIAQKLWHLNLYRPKEVLKNGYNNLNNFIRARLYQWKQEVREYNNFTCCVTGSNSNLVVHHCRGFNVLMQETIEILDFEIKDNFYEYTEEELNLFLDTFLNLQAYYNEYVCITETIHKLFHKYFGYGDNTIEQWNEFVENYNNGYYDKVA